MKKINGNKPLQLLALLAIFILGGLYGAKKQVILPQKPSPPITVHRNQAASVNKKATKVGSQQNIKTPQQRAPRQMALAAKVTNNKRYYLLDAPNDPKYANQWVLSAVHAPSAWAISPNAANVVVADIDTGFALDHQDLKDQWYINTGETGNTSEGDACWTGAPADKKTNQCDDDGNGYDDDWRGWDFYAVDNTPQAGSVNPSGDGVDHGTETAGLIGASTNNGIGMASISGGVQLMPLQVMSDTGVGYSSDIAAAIYYATDNGAKVINMSLGTSGDDPAVRDAVDYAVAHNVVVVAAAGNCGNGTQDVCSGQVAGYVTFPANYDKVVAVGAVDQSGVRASFSSYGQRVDMVAPGSGTLVSTTYVQGNNAAYEVGSMYGTSFASPIVASAAALIRSIRPNSTIDDIRALLMASTQRLGGMSGNYYTRYYGHGLLDVGKSLQVASDLNAMSESVPTLFVAGNYKAEKQYRAADALGGGCEAPAGTWCTVWLRNTTENYDRYLPYTKTNADNEAGWSWSGSVLEKGEWSIRARQGNAVSDTPHILFSK